MCIAKRSGVTDQALSPARRRLLEIIQVLHFGRIENLHVRDGQPVFVPATRIVRTEKLGSCKKPHTDKVLGTPEMKAQMTALLALFDRVGNGIVQVIQVNDGLPLLAEFEEVLA